MRKCWFACCGSHACAVTTTPPNEVHFFQQACGQHHVVSLPAGVGFTEARRWFEGGSVGEPPQPAVTIPSADAPSLDLASADAEDMDTDPPDGPAPSLASTTTRKSLPDRTFGAHHPKCLAQLPPLIRDSLPFKHIPGVGHLTVEMASLLHKFGTTGTCAEVVRCLRQLKLEKHFLSERLRAELWLLASELNDKVRAPFLPAAVMPYIICPPCAVHMQHAMHRKREEHHVSGGPLLTVISCMLWVWKSVTCTHQHGPCLGLPTRTSLCPFPTCTCCNIRSGQRMAIACSGFGMALQLEMCHIHAHIHASTWAILFYLSHITAMPWPPALPVQWELDGVICAACCVLAPECRKEACTST
jgi:hypothetical protein